MLFKVRKIFKNASSEIGQMATQAKNHIYDRLELPEEKISSAQTYKKKASIVYVVAASLVSIMILVGVVCSPILFHQIPSSLIENSGQTKMSKKVEAEAPSNTSRLDETQNAPSTSENDNPSVGTSAPTENETNSHPKQGDAIQSSVGALPAGVVKITLDELTADAELKYLLDYIPKSFPYDMEIVTIWKGDPQKKHCDLYIAIGNGSRSIMYTISDTPKDSVLLSYKEATGQRIKAQATIIDENRAICSPIAVRNKAIGIDSNIGTSDADFNEIANMISSIG